MGGLHRKRQVALIDIQAKWVSIMDNSILNWTLKIVIYMSAVLSVWKSKNKIVHIILECTYCVVISVLPVLFLSFLIVAINGSESVDIGIVMGLVSFLVVGPLV